MRRISFALLLILVLGLLVDLYAFQGVKALTAFSDATSSGIIRITYWAVSGTILVSLLACFAAFFPGKKHMSLLTRLFNVFLSVFVTKLVFVLFLLGEDIFRVIFDLICTLFGREHFPDRSFMVSLAGAVVSAIPFFAFLFGITRGKYHYKVHRTTIEYEDLPAAFDGFRVVQVSDIHSGSLENRKEVSRGVAMIAAEKPDLFVFTGDLVNNRAEEIVPWKDIFARIKAETGQYSVLGNHDYGDYVHWDSKEAKAANLNDLKRHHHEMGFRLLLDEHVILRKNGERIALVGVENWGKGFGERGKLDQALSGLEPGDFKILLSHDPTHWDEQVKNHPLNVHLTLSGHTHGMQFGIEWLGIRWSPVKYRYRNWAGLAVHYGKYLYVNRGFGFLGFSGRVGIWPEITVITLKRKVTGTGDT